MTEKQQQNITFILAMLINLLKNAINDIDELDSEFIENCSNKTELGFTLDEQLRITEIGAKILLKIDGGKVEEKFLN